MATAIFIGSLFIASAISPDTVSATAEHESAFKVLFFGFGFVMYDILSMVRK